MSNLPNIRKIIMLVWLLGLILGLIYFFMHPETFTAANIADTLRTYKNYIVVSFLVVMVARAFVLIPSTPFVFAGALLMPESPNISLTISMLGIAISATLIYYFSDVLGFRQLLLQHKPRRLQQIEAILRGPKGFFYLVAWAFFPAAPTDLACFVAGTIRMPFARYLTGILCGELIICYFYVHLGKSIWDYLL